MAKQFGRGLSTILVVADAFEPERAVVVDDGHARPTGAERCSVDGALDVVDERAGVMHVTECPSEISIHCVS